MDSHKFVLWIRRGIAAIFILFIIAVGAAYFFDQPTIPPTEINAGR